MFVFPARQGHRRRQKRVVVVRAHRASRRPHSESRGGAESEEKGGRDALGTRIPLF